MFLYPLKRARMSVFLRRYFRRGSRVWSLRRRGGTINLYSEPERVDPGCDRVVEIRDPD
jgi:hypothetical protein